MGNGDEIVLLGAGEAKRKLYEVRLDPQYWYDKAIERSWEKKLLAIFLENIRCVYFCPLLFLKGKERTQLGLEIDEGKVFFLRQSWKIMDDCHLRNCRWAAGFHFWNPYFGSGTL